MPGLAVIVAVIDSGKILLTKREDFEVWCLPGGSVEEGESLAEGAVREAKEETGLDVQLTRLVGVYSGWAEARTTSMQCCMPRDQSVVNYEPNQMKQLRLLIFRSTSCPVKCCLAIKSGLWMQSII